MYFVYILKSELNGMYYRGQTRALKARLKRHNSKLENSTSRYAPWILVWNCKKETRSEAVILESKLKNLSVKRLEHFMSKYSKSNSPDDADKAQNGFCFNSDYSLLSACQDADMARKIFLTI